MKRLFFTKKLNQLFTVVIVLSTSISAIAQSNFYRDDSFDFRGKHYASTSGSSLDNFDLHIHSTSDFRRFNLRIIKSRLNLDASFFAFRYRVDMNNDGLWEQNWTSSDDKTISYEYPNPTNGISANSTIKIQILFSNISGDTWTRTKYHQVTIFSTPRVYLNSENNVILQLRDEDASNRIPVLLVEGFDPLNENFPEKYYNLIWDLVNNNLYPNNYEVFILNFTDGGQDMRLNADILLKSIEKIHEICPNYKIALGGLSMGGLISRYALAKKEDQNGNHNVGLFFSYDSPQDGAHISPEMQDWIKGQDPSQGAVGTLQDNLNSVAAKQLLRYNTYDPGHILSDEFNNELDVLNGDGYPHKSYNVALSNGNLNATWGFGSVGRDLMTLKINDNLIKNVSAVQNDCGTGSKITDITSTRYGDVFHIPFVRIYYELSTEFNPVFIPTWSGLDLVNADINLTSGDITSFDHSNFDDYVVQTSPLEHHELSTLSQNEIMSWLDLDFDITVNYSLLNGGTRSSDIYQIPIMIDLPIQIQPETVTVNGREVVYNFLNWWDENTDNPRNFYPKQNATHISTLKGNLVSNTSRATGYNNGRRVYKYNSTIHLVYEDGGAIYYSKSLNDGNTWSAEIRLSEGQAGSTYKNPSISGVTNKVLVVYEELDDSGFTLLRFHDYDTSWNYGLIFSAYGGEGVGIGEARPVLSSNYYNRIGCAWRFKSQDNPSETHIYYSTFDFDAANHWSAVEEVPGGANGYPAIDWDDTADKKICLVWPESNEIHYIYKDNYNGLWSPVYNLTASYPSFQYNHKAPSIVTGNNLMSLVWRGEHFFYGPELYYQKFNISSSSPVKIGSLTSLHTYFYSGYTYPENPVIGISGDVAVFYEKLSGSTATMQKKVYNGSSWSSATSYGNGKFASIPHDRPTGAVWTSYTSAPYILNTDYTSGGGGETLSKSSSSDSVSFKESPLVVHKRFDYNFSADTTKFEFLSLKLTATNVNNKEVEFDDNNKGNTIHLSGSDDVVMTWETVAKDIGKDLDKMTELMYIYLVEGRERTLLEKYYLQDFYNDDKDKEGETSTSFYYSALNAKEAYLEISFGKHEPMITNIVDEGDKVDRLGKTSMNTFYPDIIPADYELKQNYPNPFNPVTHIQFGLPQSGNVVLAVYNVQGQKVAELMNGYKDAGSYEVVFNATGMASGLYFYQIQAGSFKQVKRMLLVK